MSTARLHPSLPAPVIHAGFSVPQSKSHVLAGVQDAYWSDDEAEDAECPLCLEEMDISDLNFKPCVCGYQICRFCWHHIKENLNKRCPACRRIYTDEGVEFKPIAAEDHKRLTQQKKQRDRERKDLETLGRRHLANVRVVQRNVVYVVGIGPRFAKEELIPTLRSNDYFGQYGKISKILLVKRNSPGGGGPVVGLYITYHRKEDAARCIAAVDGVPSPGGGKDIMRASYGTTKYCMAFLRSVQCNDHSCMNLHDWGDEKDCFTKEDLATLKHTIKATENRARTMTTRKGDEDAGLPRAASWAQKGSSTSTSAAASSSSAPSMISPISSRPARRPAATRTPKVGSYNDSRPSQPKMGLERKAPTASSRPSTPAAGNDLDKTVVNDFKAAKQKELTSSASPTPSASTSDVGFVQPELSPDSVVATPAHQRIAPIKPVDLNGISAPPGLPIPPGLSAPPGLPSRNPVPPGLSAPPGILLPNRPECGETDAPRTPLLATQSSYQMSTAARALVEDVKARRESSISISTISPFPDFDRTLQTLCDEDGGGFSFNLDPKLANQVDTVADLPEFESASSIPFRGSYVDAFPALRSGSPHVHSPSLNRAYSPSFPIYDPSTPRRLGHQVEKGTNKGSTYVGSFNPFSDPTMDSIGSSASTPSQRAHYSPIDDERKVSRFGFARGRQTSTAASSPLHSEPPLHYNADHHPFYQTTSETSANPLQLWQQQHHEQTFSLPHSPSRPMQVQTMSTQSQGRLSSVNGELSEAQLRSFILSSQERPNGSGGRHVEDSDSQFMPPQPFEDPAIMSAGFSALSSQQAFTPMVYGPPPGLSAPRRSPAAAVIPTPPNPAGESRGTSTQVPTVTSPTPPLLLSIEDFPALTPCSSDPAADLHVVAASRDPAISSVTNSRDKAERKAPKKASLAQKLEKQKTAQEKTKSKSVEKVKASSEKAAEKITAVISNLEPALTMKEPIPERKQPREDTVAMTAPTIQTQAITEKLAGSKKASKSTNTNSKRPNSVLSGKAPKTTSNVKETPVAVEEATPQVPLLSKKPKKNKPVVKASKAPKDEDTHEEAGPPSTTDTSKAQAQGSALDSSAANSRSQSCDRRRPPTSLQTLLEQLDSIYLDLDLTNHPFFDPQKLASPVKMPLEYGPLVHALSALSVGGGSFANSIPSGSIDNAVSSFQQLLETLTQTISDLLRLLPRTTWDDSSSFDGVLRDMLKGDDFLDDSAEDGVVKEDEVAALTLALERRARWMEVQLSKLEELHRDINTAAVKAILSFNDIGWDRNNFLPSRGNSLARFNRIGTVEEDGVRRPMAAHELEKKLIDAQEAVVFAETEIREAMEKYQVVKS